MKKQLLNHSRFAFISLFFLFSTSLLFAQVGINTTLPAAGSILDIVSPDKGVLIPRIAIPNLTLIGPITDVTGVAAELATAGLLVYNTSVLTGVGFHYWNGTDWIPLSGGATAEPPIDSATLAADVLINSTTLVNIPLTVTFTARKTSALVTLTGSGIGFASSIATAFLTVQNTTNGTNLGGFQTKIQNYSSIAIYGGGNPNSNNSNATYSTTSWSGSFSKLMTGLTIGTTYTLNVQGSASSIFGTNGFAIQPLVSPETQHLTISVIQ